jgi:hypothetical protein
MKKYDQIVHETNQIKNDINILKDNYIKFFRENNIEHNNMQFWNRKSLKTQLYYLKLFRNLHVSIVEKVIHRRIRTTLNEFKMIHDNMEIEANMFNITVRMPNKYISTVYKQADFEILNIIFNNLKYDEGM